MPISWNTTVPGHKRVLSNSEIQHLAFGMEVGGARFLE